MKKNRKDHRHRRQEDMTTHIDSKDNTGKHLMVKVYVDPEILQHSEQPRGKDASAHGGVRGHAAAPNCCCCCNRGSNA